MLATEPFVAKTSVSLTKFADTSSWRVRTVVVEMVVVSSFVRMDDDMFVLGGEVGAKFFFVAI